MTRRIIAYLNGIEAFYKLLIPICIIIIIITCNCLGMFEKHGKSKKLVVVGLIVHEEGSNVEYILPSDKCVNIFVDTNKIIKK